ncbi:MAG TPA: glycosyltransferase family 4 protein [Vicinamibacterales bacterium]|nr:glycosyltransferase family 4 protein [Vicinamibacterales bacterium]
MARLPRLRLAMLSYGLPVRGEKRGGIERAAHTLADGLARRDHEVVVFSHDPKPHGAVYEVRELPWKSFVNTWAGRRITMGYLGNVLALMPEYREFDAVVAHGDTLLAPFIGKPVLRVMHGSALGEARSATSFGRCVLQLGVYAQELATAFLQRGVVAVSDNTTRDNPFVGRVIPHGVDDSIFTPWPSSRSPEPSVLFVGALDGRKRGHLLLEGFLKTILPAHPTASLTIVGAEGPSHPGITYLTGINDADLAALYRRAWVYASPSTYEGFGLPYLEAMACGTPVVASENPGSVDVLGGGGACGLMPADAEFAEVVSALLTDQAQRTTLSTAGLHRAREFSLARMLDGYEKVLFELTEVYAKSMASV